MNVIRGDTVHDSSEYSSFDNQRFNTQPTRTPANACNTSLRTHRHGSGPVWGATALPYGSLIRYSPSTTGASPSIPKTSIEHLHITQGHKTDIHNQLQSDWAILTHCLYDIPKYIC
jgi:hypothetical protein